MGASNPDNRRLSSTPTATPRFPTLVPRSFRRPSFGTRDGARSLAGWKLESSWREVAPRAPPSPRGRPRGSAGRPSAGRVPSGRTGGEQQALRPVPSALRVQLSPPWLPPSPPSPPCLPPLVRVATGLLPDEPAEPDAGLVRVVTGAPGAPVAPDVAPWEPLVRVATAPVPATPPAAACEPLVRVATVPVPPVVPRCDPLAPVLTLPPACPAVLPPCEPGPAAGR